MKLSRVGRKLELPWFFYILIESNTTFFFFLTFLLSCPFDCKIRFWFGIEGRFAAFVKSASETQLCWHFFQKWPKCSTIGQGRRERTVFGFWSPLKYNACARKNQTGILRSPCCRLRTCDLYTTTRFIGVFFHTDDLFCAVFSLFDLFLMWYLPSILELVQRLWEMCILLGSFCVRWADTWSQAALTLRCAIDRPPALNSRISF